MILAPMPALAPGISSRMCQGLLRLSDEVRLTTALRSRLIDIACHRSYKEIAVRHDITVNTVKTQVRDLLRALGLDCRHEIEHAIRSAERRLQNGASEELILTFLRLRWE